MAVKLKTPVRPKKLVQGETVGVVAPAGPVNLQELERGLTIIRGMGFNILLGEHLKDRREYLAGSDADRAGDLAAVRDRANGTDGKVPLSRLAGGHRAGDLPTRCDPPATPSG